MIFLFPIHTEIKLFRIKFMRFKRNFGWPKHARVRLGGRVGWVGVDWWSTKHLTQRIMAWPAFLCPLREEKREIGQSTRYPARRIPIAWMLHARWCCDGMGLQKEKYSHDKRAWPICIDALAVCRPTHPTSILHSCAACVASCLCARISRWRVAVWPIYHFYRSSDHVHRWWLICRFILWSGSYWWHAARVISEFPGKWEAIERARNIMLPLLSGARFQIDRSEAPSRARGFSLILVGFQLFSV